jgi:hypothetical protein
MTRKLWDLIGAVVVLTIVLVILVQAITPYLWIVGVGAALIIVTITARIMFNRFWH